MFAEDSIYGKLEVQIENRRFSLPSFTFAEKGDKLCFQSSDECEFDIYRQDYIDEMIDKITEKILNSDNPEEIKKLKNQLTRYYLTIIKSEIVKEQRRLQIPKDFKTDEPLMVVGAKNHVRIYKLSSYNKEKEKIDSK